MGDIEKTDDVTQENLEELKSTDRKPETTCGRTGSYNLSLDTDKKVLPLIVLFIAVGLSISLFIARLNIISFINAVVCSFIAAYIFLELIIKKRISVYSILAYFILSSSIVIVSTIWGADAGFGAFISGRIGFMSSEHPLTQGDGNFGTRMAGNFLIWLPSIAFLIGTFLVLIYVSNKERIKKMVVTTLSSLLIISSVFAILTMNLRMKPAVKRLYKGHDEYLENVDKAPVTSPNILYIMMDDLGYGDVSYNGAIFDTPNIDSIAQKGVDFENFYANYSVCSPSRFAAMTGRYPYRGYADNVIFPTVATLEPFASTRIFNSIEMGANADGMLGDEITLAEILNNAGYDTACFGKWHLGDYGEYLPTNQGFDYFYGSHHVNDMNPFYHVREEGGEYEIVQGTKELKDQSNATKYIFNDLNSWLDKKEGGNPFFMWLTAPWPHAPVYVGDEFKGVTGLGTYADCVVEWDAYLGKLFKRLETSGELDNTLIIFTSDNGPALEGSTALLRGGKYTAYEGGQKVATFMRWDNNPLFTAGKKIKGSATVMDLFPTIVDLVGITGYNGTRISYLPFDREIDGVSIIPLLDGTKNSIHGKQNPILHMKRENIKAVQYAIDVAIIKNYPESKNYTYDVLQDNDYMQFKYFRRIENDNPAFFNLIRKNWLIGLTDDEGENYNRATVYPSIAEEMNIVMTEWTNKFKNNRRGINKDYYK
jgi:arylsulfatase A-like enzyme